LEQGVKEVTNRKPAKAHEVAHAHLVSLAYDFMGHVIYEARKIRVPQTIEHLKRSIDASVNDGIYHDKLHAYSVSQGGKKNGSEQDISNAIFEYFSSHLINRGDNRAVDLPEFAQYFANLYSSARKSTRQIIAGPTRSRKL
jgi:hypothetical protein